MWYCLFALQPLFSGLNERILSRDISIETGKIVEELKKLDFKKALDHYNNLAIGNNIWPIKYFQNESNSRFSRNLWIIEGALNPAARANQTQEQLQTFVSRLDNMQTCVFDSQSLCEYLRLNDIPIKTLPTLIDLSKIPGIRILLQTEIIARTAKKLLSRRYPDIEKKDYNVETVKFFNLILGNDEESTEFWDKTLIPAINKKFKIELNRNIALLHLPQLFFSLQFHTGVDFNSSKLIICSTPPSIVAHNN